MLAAKSNIKDSIAPVISAVNDPKPSALIPLMLTSGYWTFTFAKASKMNEYYSLINQKNKATAFEPQTAFMFEAQKKNHVVSAQLSYHRSFQAQPNLSVQSKHF